MCKCLFGIIVGGFTGWYRQRYNRSLGKFVCHVWCRLHYSRSHYKLCHRVWYKRRCNHSHHILYRLGWCKPRCSRNLGRRGCPGWCKPHRSRNLCRCACWRMILLREQRRTARRRRGTAGRKVCKEVSSCGCETIFIQRLISES